jgi:hypothetical protein
MRPEKTKNRTGIGPHRRHPQFAKILMISDVEIGYVRRSEIRPDYDLSLTIADADCASCAVGVGFARRHRSPRRR